MTENLLEVPPQPLFTTYGYANIGVPVNLALQLNENSVYNPPDKGLGPIVNDEKQDGKFKIPTLRNIAVSAPYSHNGNFPTLYDMVSFINNSSQFDEPEVDRNISSTVGKMGMTEDEIADLIDFLNTLTDDY